MKQTICELTNKNRRLRNTVNHLQGALVSQKQRDLLYKDFEQDLFEDVNSLEQRLNKLEQLTKDVNKFSSPNRELYPTTSKKNTPNEPEESLRAKATEEHHRLTQEALFNERKIVLMRMKLKLCHDRRDLVALRDNLNMFEGGGKTMMLDKEMEETLKIQIHNIKMKQLHEKERIEREKSPNIEFHDAATSIQSAWRGFKCRMNFKSLMENRHQQNNQTTEQQQNSPQQE